MNENDSASNDEIDRLQEAAWEAPDKLTEAQLLNQAIGLADAAGDAERGWELRTSLFEPACFSGQIDLLLLHFAWCISAVDREPDRFDVGELMWTYKWVIDEATNFPHVPLARLYEMADDFGRRVKQQADAPRTIAYARYIVAMSTFDLAEARRLYEQWRDASRDFLSDCRACEANRVVEMYAYARDDDAALEAATPILSRKMRCAEVPDMTYGTLLLPALRLGKPDLARGYFTAGLRRVDGTGKLLRTLGEHLQYLALTHSTDYGLRVLTRNIGNVIAAPAVMQRVPFWLGAELLMRRLSDAPGVTIDFPSTFPLASADRTYRPSELADHFAGLVDDLSRQFDQRNGNTWLTDRAAHVRGLLERTAPDVVPLPKPRKKAAPKKDEG